MPPSLKSAFTQAGIGMVFFSISELSSWVLVEISSVSFPLGFSSVRLHSVRQSEEFDVFSYQIRY
jgi:hypothetical protein